MVPVARAITESFGPLAAQKGLELTFESHGEPWVMAEPDALEIILLNLLSNAVKYTPSGGRIVVTVRSDAEGLAELSVSDSGIGIPEEDQQTVFERFRRAGDNGERIPGAGIGLALVSELVQAHSGKVRLTSAPGEGTRVTVNLPRCEPRAQDEGAEQSPVLSEAVARESELLSDAVSSPAAEPAAEDDGKPRVLIVEDNGDLRCYLAELLGSDYHCDLAADGAQALEAAFEHIPDLVLLDLMLPKLDGFQVSHALKEDERTSHIPIVMLTARQDRESRLEGWQERIDAYFTKPFDDDELKLRIANLLEIRDILKQRFRNHFFEEPAPQQILNPKESRFVERLEQILEASHGDPEFGLAQMAAGIFMSPRQLQRKLKATLGHNPSEYLRSFRLRRSRELLKTGLQVGTVADAVGFSSPAYFTSCFKAQFGETPSEYQQKFMARVVAT
jgi:CheY-like chemotaxis protein